MTTSTSQEIMILGGPNAGKTHFGGQVYGRLQRTRGRWRITSTPDDLTVFAEVLRCLDAGLAAPHTAFETHRELRCWIEHRDGLRADLRWPDYGGEQFEAILRTRSVPDTWQARLTHASGWLLLLRAGDLRRREDRIDRPPPAAGAAGHQRGSASWDSGVQLVETLQILMAQAGMSAGRRLVTPRLAVVLSCWDELVEPKSPRVELHRRLPLLESFIGSRWQDERWSVWGLSSLERALDQTKPDLEFCEIPPEQRGYIVAPGTTEHERDLTLPIDWLLGGRT